MKKRIDGMKNFEVRRSHGFCGHCAKHTDALWERFGETLLISCERCGTIILRDEKRFTSLSTNKNT